MNEEDARKDTFMFWALKVPAIAVSASAGLFVHFHQPNASIIASAIGSGCILADGLLRAGTLRNVHVRAFHDLRNLQNEITRQWQIGCFQKKDEDELAAQILQNALKQQAQIQAYLKAAESSLPETKSK